MDAKQLGLKDLRDVSADGSLSAGTIQVELPRPQIIPAPSSAFSLEHIVISSVNRADRPGSPLSMLLLLAPCGLGTVERETKLSVISKLRQGRTIALLPLETPAEWERTWFFPPTQQCCRTPLFILWGGPQ